MKHLTLLFSTIVFFLLSSDIYSQSIERQVIASAGNSSAEGGISLEWTLGEGFVETFDNGGLILTQGFHQGNITTTSVTYFQNDVEMYFAPNPTSERIILFSTFDKPVNIQISDLYGRILMKKKNLTTGQPINLAKLAAGSYFVNFSNSSLKLATQILIKQ